MTRPESTLPSAPRTIPGRSNAPRELDAEWLRHSLGICGYLERSRALCPTDGAVVTFAVRWAPYGGASPEDLLVAFGVGRNRFLSMLDTALTPGSTEEHKVRELKRSLHEDLAASWSGPSRVASIQ